MNTRNWLVDIPRISMILFVFLNIVAMLIYPGSTLLDNLNNPSTSYSFINNFLSDLGRYMTYDGNPNFYSSLLFNSSMMISGAVLALFFLHIRTIFNIHSGLLYWLSILGTIAGIAGGYSMIGVALTPADLDLDSHILCANWLFRFFLIAAICYSIIIFKSNLIDNKYAIGYCIFTVLMLVYILVSELGPMPIEHIPGSDPVKNPGALIFQVVAQKSILFCFLITIYIQTKGLALILDK